MRLESHVVVDGKTTIGAGTHVFPFVSIGLAPQDLKYAGEPSETRIGCRNQIREFVTIHRGTANGGLLTQTGDDCLIMAQAHVAHDCIIGNGVIMANAATLAGHVVNRRSSECRRLFRSSSILPRGREAYIGGIRWWSRRFAFRAHRGQSRTLLRSIRRDETAGIFRAKRSKLCTTHSTCCSRLN